MITWKRREWEELSGPGETYMSSDWVDYDCGQLSINPNAQNTSQNYFPETRKNLFNPLASASYPQWLKFIPEVINVPDFSINGHERGAEWAWSVSHLMKGRADSGKEKYISSFQIRFNGILFFIHEFILHFIFYRFF